MNFFFSSAIGLVASISFFAFSTSSPARNACAIAKHGDFLRGLFYSPANFLRGVEQLGQFWASGNTPFEQENALRVKIFLEALFIPELRKVLSSSAITNIRKDEEEASPPYICEQTARLLSGHKEIVRGLYLALREYDTLVMWKRLFEQAKKLGIPSVLPELVSSAGISFKELRNPTLVLRQDPASDKDRFNPKLFGAADICPFDIDLSPQNPVWVISGGNGNGKTHILEAVGNAIIMANRGIPIFARAASLEPVGALEMNVNVSRHTLTASAFQNEILRYIEVFAEIDRVREKGLPAVVLMDEPGRGTSRVDGYALLSGFIAGCISRGAYVVASTHYNKIGELLIDPKVKILTVDSEHHLKKGAAESGAIARAAKEGYPDEIVSEAHNIYLAMKEGRSVALDPVKTWKHGETAENFEITPYDALQIGVWNNKQQFVDQQGNIDLTMVPREVYDIDHRLFYLWIGPAALVFAENSPIALEEARTSNRPEDEAPSHEFSKRVVEIPRVVGHWVGLELTRSLSPAERESRYRWFQSLVGLPQEQFDEMKAAVSFGAYFEGLLLWYAQDGSFMVHWDDKEDKIRHTSEALDKLFSSMAKDIAEEKKAYLNFEAMRIYIFSRLRQRLGFTATLSLALSDAGLNNPDAPESAQITLDELGAVSALIEEAISSLDLEKLKQELVNKINSKLSLLLAPKIDPVILENSPLGPVEAQEYANGIWIQIMGFIKENWKRWASTMSTAVPALTSLYKKYLELNALLGFAETVREQGWARAEESDSLSLSRSRSPILTGSMAADEVVPLSWPSTDLDGTPVMVLTGTNGGGKTHAALGLAMAALCRQQFGYVPGSSASIPKFGRIIAAIETAGHTAEASSFTGELRRLKRVIDLADSDAGAEKPLIFLDEPAKGTSGEEAAALQSAIARYLAKHSAKVVLTTNYTELFEYVDRMPKDTLPHRPLSVEFFGDKPFELQEGRGRSSGIDVAEKMGLPTDVIDFARKTAAALESGRHETVPHLPAFLHSPLNITAPEH
ncbi:hypothetical protein HZC34_00735 [Candidatus Saganbacteria bacterium]|nr:hypothetical protein [Candidatus Saganbacteria bacterium]